MAVLQYSYGVAVEGVGLDTAKSEGTCWYFGPRLSSAQESASSYDWEGGTSNNTGLVMKDSMVISTSVDPFTGDLRDSAFTFELHYSDTAAQNFIYQQTTTDLYMSGGATVGTNLSATGTTIIVEGPNDTGLAGTVVWLTDEAIKLGTHAGSGQYNSCTRGYYGTTGQMHLEKELVYTANNYLYGRRVRLIQFDHSDDSETVKWTGFVSEIPRTSPDGTKLVLKCQGLISVLSGALVNRGAPNLAKYSSIKLVSWPGNVTKPFGTVSHATRTVAKRVAKPGDVAHKQFYQAGEVLIAGDYSDTSEASQAGTKFDMDNSTGALFGGNWDPEALERGRFAVFRNGIQLEKYGTTDPVYEVFGVNRLWDETNGYAAADMFSATRDLTYPFHPIDISMALLTSTRRTTASTSTTTWDALNYRWALGMPTGWFDTASIAAIIDDTKDRKVDKLYLGWNGEPVRVWDVIKKTLSVPHGFFWGTSSDGTITVARFRGRADVEDFVNATAITAIPSTVEWIPSRSDNIDTITGRVGATPWYDGVPIEVNAIDYASGESTDSLRAALFHQRRETEIDYQTLTDPDELVETLISKIVSLHLSAPRMRMRAGNSDAYDIGAFVTFTIDISKYPENNGWFVDNAGAMTGTTAGLVQFLGQILGRKFDLRTQTYELELMLTNYRTGDMPRHRAPSGEIASYTTGPPVKVTFANTAFSTDDAGKFRTSEVIEVFKPDYTLRSGSAGSPDAVGVNNAPAPYGTAAAGTIELTAAFATTPSAGDIIELAHLKTSTGYPEDGLSQPYLGGTDQTYTFLGTGSAVGDAANTAHTYADE